MKYVGGTGGDPKLPPGAAGSVLRPLLVPLHPIAAPPQMLEDPVSCRVCRIGALVRMRLEHDPAQQRPDPAQREGHRKA